MGKYNFDEIIDRRGTSCNKWEYNVPEDVVPMWVADMDFAAAPEIREAMQKTFRSSCLWIYSSQQRIKRCHRILGRKTLSLEYPE